MNWWQRLRRRERLEDELDAELEFHVDRLTTDLMRDGLSERDARREAAREFGAIAEIKDNCRRARGTEWLVDLLTDARIGLRILRKERSFSIVAVGSLSLGLGVSTVFFSLVYASCLAPLPFPGVGRLVDVSLRDDSGRQPSLTLAQARVIADNSPVAGVGYFTRRTLPVRTRNSSARRAAVAYVSTDALELIGAEPTTGRGFGREEYRDSHGAPAVVSANLATDFFGSADQALGRELLVDTVPAVIVGVIADPAFPDRTAVWQPLSALSLAPDEPSLSLFAALKSGGPEAADVSAISESVLRSRSLLSDRVHVTIAPLDSRYHSDITNPAWIAFIMAGALVVLIASSNVSSLLLSRGVRRTNEIATRLSLGATRARVFRQVLAEAAVLGAVACGGGAFVAWISLRGLRAEMPATAYPTWAPIALDWHAAAMLIAVGAATVFLCGLAPAWQLVKTPATPWHARTTTSSRSVERWSAAFLTMQLAISMVLLCEVGLTVQLYRALATPRAPAHLADVLTANISLSPRKYAAPQERRAFYAGLQARLLSTGLITNASFEAALPGTQRVPQRVAAGSIHEPGALVGKMTVDSGFFETVGVTLESGRTFRTEASDLNGAVLVNDRFAALFFGTAAAVGQQIRLIPASGDSRGGAVSRTIVGVVPSFADQAILSPPPLIFVPRDLGQAATSTLIVRGTEPPQQLASVVTDAVAKADRDVAVADVVPLIEASWQARWLNRLSQTLITSIASIGFFLAMIGVAALTAHRVASRARELSVRVALGATPRDVVRTVLRPLAAQLAAGLLLGGVLTIVWERVFGTPGARPANLLLVAFLLTAASLLFSAWPARRAAHADPVAALNSGT